MKAEKQAIDQIFKLLKTKARLKQKTYRNVIDVFGMLKRQAEDIVHQLFERISKIDETIAVELNVKSDFEFQIKVGSDILVFSLTTNVITFDNDYVIMTSDYVKEKEDRKYFGQIRIYNFMSDTIKYNRVNDPGYLIARLLINSENHFYVEGVQQLNFLFTDISNNLINKDWLRLLIEKSILACVDMDLMGSKYPEIQNTTFGKKLEDETPMGNGQKLGFQMNYMGEIKG